MKCILFAICISITILSCKPGDTSSKNAKTNVVEYLNVPGPLSLIDKSYLLSWTSHPADNYYKQEYIPAGQNLEHYTDMILLEVALGEMIPQDVAMEKAKEINARKMTDQVAAYNLGRNQFNGEVLLDFVLSEGEGSNTIAEWNIYRYKPYTDDKGRKGIQLFGWSRRVYGTGFKTLADDYMNNRKPTVVPFMEMKYPEVMIVEK